MSVYKGRVERSTFRVFISYSTKNLALAKRVDVALKEAGATSFLADRSVAGGEDFDERIWMAIDCCDAFILVWSGDASSSEWVRDELGHARGKKKFIVPVVLDGADRLPEFLRSVKYLGPFNDIDAGLRIVQGRVGALFQQKREAIDRRSSNGFGILLAVGIAASAVASGKGADR